MLESASNSKVCPIFSWVLVTLFLLRVGWARSALALQCTHREKPDKKPLKDINVEMSGTSAKSQLLV